MGYVIREGVPAQWDDAKDPLALTETERAAVLTFVAQEETARASKETARKQRQPKQKDINKARSDATKATSVPQLKAVVLSLIDVFEDTLVYQRVEVNKEP